MSDCREAHFAKSGLTNENSFIFSYEKIWSCKKKALILYQISEREGRQMSKRPTAKVEKTDCEG